MSRPPSWSSSRPPPNTSNQGYIIAARDDFAWSQRRETKNTVAVVRETLTVSIDDGYAYVSDDWGVLLTGPETNIITLSEGDSMLTNSEENATTMAADHRLLITETNAS